MKILSKSELKFANSLNLKKYRQKYNKFIVEGHKIINELNKLYPDRIDMIISDKLDLLEEMIRAGSVKSDQCRLINSLEFSKLTNLVSPQSILAIAEMNFGNNESPEEGEWYIYLDSLQDPGNVGTIIRTADWFGIRNIIFSKGSVDPYNSKVVQASMGSIFRMKFYFMNFEEFKGAFSEFDIWGADLNGTKVNDIQFGQSGVLCLGNEGEGLSEEVRSICSKRIFIPGGGSAVNPGAESLNVAIASGIIMSKIQNT